jgi:hypothetical protein
VPAAIRDRSIAEAMDQVLAAEREATAAIASASADADKQQRAALEARRRILDRARRRAMRVHELMQQRLAVELSELERARRAATLPAAALEGLAEAAAQSVAQWLASDADERA